MSLFNKLTKRTEFRECIAPSLSLDDMKIHIADDFSSDEEDLVIDFETGGGDKNDDTSITMLVE